MWWIFTKIGGLLTRATGAAIKGTVDTVKSATDIEKNRLDIKLKKKELEDGERLIQPASFDDVMNFDPTIEKIKHKSARPPIYPNLSSRGSNRSMLVFITVVAFVMAIFLIRGC